MDIKEIIKELKKFSDEITETYIKLTDYKVIFDFEDKYHLQLPNDYKEFICTFSNGFTLMGDIIFGMYPDIDTPNNMIESYIYEHENVQIPQWAHLVPFCPDGGGNFYCFDTSRKTNRGNSCEIVFWVSNYFYNSDDLPEVTHNDFVSFVKEVFIDWALEDYNYDGTVK